MDVKKILIGSLIIVGISSVSQAQQRSYLDKFDPAHEKSITIYDKKGNPSIGSYNRELGTYFMAHPDNSLEIGRTDPWGNLVIQEYGDSDNE